MLHKVSVAFGAVVLGFSAPALADTTTYNSAPVDGFHYGTGNDYTPANAVVSTAVAGPYTPGSELALRFHQTGEVAPASDGNGVYSFALGTSPISFDWSDESTHFNALITLTNLLTGQTVSYNPFFPGNDNYTSTLDPDLAQNSARLNFSFLSGLGFDPNVNDTYQATFASGGGSVTAFAQIGSGAPAVPEPATWAMMLLGFGAIGFSMRRSRSQMGTSRLA